MPRAFIVVLLLHAYVLARVVPDLPFGTAGALVVVLLILANAVSMPFGFAWRRRRVAPAREALRWAGLVAIGFFSSLVMLTLARDLALIVVALVPGSGWPHASIGFREATALAVPALAALLSIVGFANAQRRARIRHVEVPIARLPDGLDGFRIVQISDLHVGPTIRRRHVEAVVDAVNGLVPDLVAITGDLVDGTVAELAHHTEPLAKLSARHGTFFVTGNHEYYSGVRAWIAELRKLGMTVLLNEHVVVRHAGEMLVVAGVTDLSGHRHDRSHASDPERAIADAPADAPLKLLLAHQPSSAFAAARAGFHLQLSGHTHGGQFLPWNLVVRFFHPFTAGLHRLHALWVYVSRGTGYWGPPKRLMAPSEITHLTLVRAGKRT